MDRTYPLDNLSIFRTTGPSVTTIGKRWKHSKRLLIQYTLVYTRIKYVCKNQATIRKTLSYIIPADSCGYMTKLENIHSKSYFALRYQLWINVKLVFEKTRAADHLLVLSQNVNQFLLVSSTLEKPMIVHVWREGLFSKLVQYGFSLQKFK